eukprot:15395289-Alexandrium_andersonii.AAC.1
MLACEGFHELLKGLVRDLFDVVGRRPVLDFALGGNPLGRPLGNLGHVERQGVGEPLGGEGDARRSLGIRLGFAGLRRRG